MKLINRINRKIPHLPETRDDIYILNIIPVDVDSLANTDSIIITGHQFGIDAKFDEHYVIDKLYYTKDVQTIFTEALMKNDAVRIECVQYRGFKNFVSKKYNTWKVIQIANNSAQHWIQVDQHSKLF